jgi:glycosyltransferase involved in cell wall biosynthesis
MIAREVREYALADLVIVLSSFAARTFLAEGYPNERLRVLPLGSDLSRFRPGENVVQERCRRILANEPIRVLTVGSFTYQKGMYDLAHVAERLCGRFKFRFVGDCPWETHRLRRQCLRKIEFVPRQPQFGLARQYQDGDLFLFPTIQDGYAAVLAQAQASGLPLLTTTNCAGPDLIREGASGWVVPIRDSNALVERLIWCDSHREQLVRMVRDTFLKFQPRDWAQVAVDLKSIYYEALGHCQDVQDNGTRS